MAKIAGWNETGRADLSHWCAILLASGLLASISTAPAKAGNSWALPLVGGASGGYAIHSLVQSRSAQPAPATIRHRVPRLRAQPVSVQPASAQARLQQLISCGQGPHYPGRVPAAPPGDHQHTLTEAGDLSQRAADCARSDEPAPRALRASVLAPVDQSCGNVLLITVDTIIVGGGPAGSSCAWRLGKRGVDCLVLDRAEFPRLKLCAGWVTPQVLRDLEIEPGEYPFSFLTFESLRLQLQGPGLSLRTRQHSIRRIEFDAWLLQRPAAR